MTNTKLACDDHSKTKSSLEAFREGAKNIRFWAAKAVLGHDLLLGECQDCYSSITFAVNS